MFNTLGNLLVDPRCGLLVVDFDGARALALTGRATIDWAWQDPDGRAGGTGRAWRVRPEVARVVTLPPAWRWSRAQPT